MTKLNGLKIVFAVFAFWTLTGVNANAQTFTTLAKFEALDAGPQFVTPVQGEDGKLYGTTQVSIFNITPTGSLSEVGLSYHVVGSPDAGLILGTDGNLYGTTFGGGANNAGTVFKVSPTGVVTILHNFCSEPMCADGNGPTANLIEGIDGNFYGTTSESSGTVFKITRSGVLTTLHTFDGDTPRAPLMLATDGNFYSTTNAGGAFDEGTVFRITPAGVLTTLYSFGTGGGFGGIRPLGGLVQASDGYLYGTTYVGGTYGTGTIFRITLQGNFELVHAFNATVNGDGGAPTASLIQGTDGNLYGTTLLGGTSDDGSIYQVAHDGTVTTLHSFAYVGNGEGGPLGGLVQGTNGVFYGTTNMGGDLNCGFGNGCGTVFSLDLGLGPFVTFVYAAGRVGQTGGILGQGLTGTTSVMVNGMSANFTVVSDTFIKATVPQDASTGYVTVTTPTGVLTSNVPFHVIQ